ncbi:aspartate/glutamate racemase family protein [Burkholderia latens]|uniref:aspartate/glutamate racemase family protein n=1 Tax=Burkholderia latens TaxID=488446 RepID=UPI00158AC91F|nr:amino acid racemase [Burkholderia latens]
MERLGLVGGVSWVSTMEYYRRLNVRAQMQGGGHVSADLVLVNLNFESILARQMVGDDVGEYKILERAGEIIQRAGASKLLVCSNTTNHTCDRLQEHLDLQVVNIIDATAAHIQRCGYKRVGLLGTRYVMERAFYRERLQNTGIEVVTPEPPDRRVIHDVIYQELCHGIFSPVSRDILTNTVERLASREVDAVILGCTELPLALPAVSSEVGIPVIDSIDAHLDAACGSWSGPLDPRTLGTSLSASKSLAARSN